MVRDRTVCVSDSRNKRLRRVNPDGRIKTVVFCKTLGDATKVEDVLLTRASTIPVGYLHREGTLLGSDHLNEYIELFRLRWDCVPGTSHAYSSETCNTRTVSTRWFGLQTLWGPCTHLDATVGVRNPLPASSGSVVSESNPGPLACNH